MCWMLLKGLRRELLVDGQFSRLRMMVHALISRMSYAFNPLNYAFRGGKGWEGKGKFHLHLKVVKITPSLKKTPMAFELVYSQFEPVI